MHTTTIVDDLNAVLRGDVIAPGDESYAEARSLWNGMIDRRPLAIARCQGSADVVATLDVARRHDIPVSVRSGGHGVAGRALRDGGIVIDLAALDGVQVDAKRRVARVGPGATWHEVDAETQAFGLATTGGVHSGTGVGGLALGGGLGYLARSYGMTVDNIRSIDVVLADGRLVTASASEHPDLYWASRGGGGNFGIVTSFELELHEVGPEVATAQAYFPMEHAGSALRAYRDFMAGAPDEVACYALVVNVPPIDAFPVERHGTVAVALVACHSGSTEAGAEALAPLTEIDGSFLAFVAPMAYADLQSAFDAGSPDGARYYWKAQLLDDLPDATIDAVVELATPMPGPFSMVFVEPMGGAISRVPADATAFPHRSARFSLGVAAGWTAAADDERAVEWARRLHAAVAPDSNGGVYGNYLDGDEDDRVDAAYRANLERLQRVKAIYDPDNVFDQNVNVQPGP